MRLLVILTLAFAPLVHADSWSKEKCEDIALVLSTFDKDPEDVPFDAGIIASVVKHFKCPNNMPDEECKNRLNSSYLENCSADQGAASLGNK